MKTHDGTILCGVGLLAVFITAMPLETGAVSRVDVGGGTLDVGAVLSTGELHVGPAGTLGGEGTIFGSVMVEGTLAPSARASSPVQLYVYGSVSFLPGSSYLCHVVNHNDTDYLAVDGTLNGVCTVVPSRESTAIPVDVSVCGLKFGSFSGFSLLPADESDWRLEPSGARLLLTHLTGDSDGNGLPDWFELEYFLVRTGTDPEGHDDDDSMTNEEEWIAGTDPTDTASWFGLNIVCLGEDDFRVEWPSVEGRLYSIYFGEAVTNRTTPIWEDMTAQPPTNTLGLSNWSTLFDTTFIHGTVRRDAE